MNIHIYRREAANVSTDSDGDELFTLIRFFFEEFANLFKRLLKRVNVEYAEFMSEHSATDSFRHQYQENLVPDPA